MYVNNLYIESSKLLNQASKPIQDKTLHVSTNIHIFSCNVLKMSHMFVWVPLQAKILLAVTFYILNRFWGYSLILLENIKQTYIETKALLKRSIIVHLPPRLDDPLSIFLNFAYFLDSISKAGSHLVKTYLQVWTKWWPRSFLLRIWLFFYVPSSVW